MANLKEKIVRTGIQVTTRIPFLKPIMKKFYKKFMKKYYTRPLPTPKFSGWGMTTISEHAWNDKFDCDVFRQSCKDLQKFEFTPSTVNEPYDEHMYSLNYRHYFISFCANYAIQFGQTDNHNFVECGVNDGVTAFFALNEFSNKLGTNFKMHLYDSWSAMKAEFLIDSEINFNVGAYHDSSIDRSKSNLQKFSKNIIYHKGFVPETFDQLPQSPESISYLSIDLNSSKSTLATLNFFLPKLVKGGIIIFDDYGSTNYPDTKYLIDEFFSTKSGMLMKIPTGQAIYLHK
jgi:O-methyltransferase